MKTLRTIKPLPLAGTFRKRHWQRQRRIAKGQQLPPLDVSNMPSPEVTPKGWYGRQRKGGNR